MPKIKDLILNKGNNMKRKSENLFLIYPKVGYLFLLQDLRIPIKKRLQEHISL